MESLFNNNQSTNIYLFFSMLSKNLWLTKYMEK
jgi:hypothetical protein